MINRAVASRARMFVARGLPIPGDFVDFIKREIYDAVWSGSSISSIAEVLGVSESLVSFWLAEFSSSLAKEEVDQAG